VNKVEVGAKSECQKLKGDKGHPHFFSIFIMAPQKIMLPLREKKSRGGFYYFFYFIFFSTSLKPMILTKKIPRFTWTTLGGGGNGNILILFGLES